MIPCNEVRIGNYVLIDNQIKKIALINNDKSHASADHLGFRDDEGKFENYSYANVQPIPLTDEILKQCGFAFHDYFHFWQKITPSSVAKSEMDIDREYNVIDFMRRPIVKKVNSLHQLQNIFFALKGFEIAFNPLPPKERLTAELQETNHK